MIVGYSGLGKMDCVFLLLNMESRMGINQLISLDHNLL